MSLECTPKLRQDKWVTVLWRRADGEGEIEKGIEKGA
jgi:hypothetical protein